MNVIVNEKTRTFTLESCRTSYVIDVGPAGELRHLYYGAKTAASDDLSMFAAREDRAFSPNPEGLTAGDSLNLAPQELSGFGSGDFRITGCRIGQANGSAVTRLAYEGFRVVDGKEPLEGLPASFAGEGKAKTLILVLRDLFSRVKVELSYTVFEGSDVMARSVRVTNDGKEPVTLEKLSSLQLDFGRAGFDLLYGYGHWAQERHVERVKLHHGTQGFRSARGSTGHQYNPSFVLASPTASEFAGEAYGALLVYSGSFAFEAEVDEFNMTRLLLGINPENFSWHLTPGESFQGPEALFSFTESGFNALSQSFSDFLMEHVIRSPWKHRQRPVLINNWEATYFDFNAEKILALAHKGASLGMELLVLDDGWFGHRSDDTTSLGDWFVTPGKVGDLGELVRGVNAAGLKFGLWFEPEMISEKSELYKAHPEWVLCVPGFPRSEGRHQLVLDFSRQEVVNYIFEAVAKVLHSANVEYVKWDMNRNLTEIYSAALPPERQGEVAHRYVLGVYQLHERLINEFPNLLIEGCSGGGGRFDAGMLYYVPQIWCSDDSDAFERVPVQLGTSLFYPCSTMGAHVSVCPNHQTGRTTPFDFRAAVALSGTFGYELDITKFTQEEDELVRRQIERYHRYNDLVREGRFYRLTEGFGEGAISAWNWVSRDGKEALGIMVCLHDVPCSQREPAVLRFAGLEAETLYELEDGRRFHGSTLMKAGLNVSSALKGDASHAFCHLTAVK